MSSAFALLVLAMILSPHKAPEFRAPNNHIEQKVQEQTPIAKGTRTFLQQQPTQRLIGPSNGQMPTPYYLSQEVPQNEYPAAPEGVPMITVCYKNDAGQWVVEVRTFYSGNTPFEPSDTAYEFTGVCPRL